MKIAIHARKISQDRFPYLQQLLSELQRRNAQVFLSQMLRNLLRDSPIRCDQFPVYETIPEVDFVISVGGDGTLLDTVTHVGDKEFPILGINIGRLGFLATVSQDKIKEALDALYQRQYSDDYRTLVAVDKDFSADGLNFALNDLTIIKKDTSSMIGVHAYVDGAYLNAYWADGLIVATPTGSTGYSLSCGGPVLAPQSSNLIITPISPHNLTVRPLVIPDDSVITVEIEDRDENRLLSLDSRSYPVTTHEKISICKANFRVRLVKFEGYHFFNTLRQKLNWGLDARN